MYTVQWNPWEKIKGWPQFWSIYNKQVRQGEKGCCSGESTCIPPMWLASSNLGVEAISGLSLLLVLSLAPRGFSPAAPVFPFPQKPTLPNSTSIWNAQTHLNEFIRTPKCFVGKQITIYNIIYGRPFLSSKNSHFKMRLIAKPLWKCVLFAWE